MSAGFRIGARTSRLARRQADIVIAALEAEGAADVEYVGVRTSGDLAPELPIGRIGGTGVFTRELERALRAGEIDAAVHSLKDLETSQPDGLTLGAVPAREDPGDVIVLSARLREERGDDGTPVLDALPRGATVGTASLRRRAFLLRLRPDLDIADLRGNVPTRLERLADGSYDAIVLAAAGLRRLGATGEIDGYLEAVEFPPAPGQGAIAVQIRADDERAIHLTNPLNDPAARAEVTAERAFLQRIEGGCQAPAGALGRLDGDTITLMTLVCSPDGRTTVAASAAGLADEAAAVGVAAADRALEDGAERILAPLREAAAEE